MSTWQRIKAFALVVLLLVCGVGLPLLIRTQLKAPDTSTLWVAGGCAVGTSYFA